MRVETRRWSLTAKGAAYPVLVIVEAWRFRSFMEGHTPSVCKFGRLLFTYVYYATRDAKICSSSRVGYSSWIDVNSQAESLIVIFTCACSLRAYMRMFLE
jgi:hypothetical protein